MKNELTLDRIRKFINEEQFFVTNHARIRMFQRNVTTETIKKIILKGEIIEEYPDDFPCKSVLIFGFDRQTPIHIVAALCVDHARIITVYKPEAKIWSNFTKRKK